MKVVAWLFLSALLLFSDVTIDRNISGIIHVQTPQSETDKEQERLQSISTQEKKPISGISLKVLEVNMSKNSSIKVEYSPEFKHGDTIDNKKETTIKYQYKF